MNNEKNLQNSLDLAFESLDSCNTYIDHLTGLVYKTIEAYQSGDINQGNIAFADMIEILDLYVQLMTKIYASLRQQIKEPINKDDSFQNLEIHLLSIMKAILPAKEKGDIIMLCDLLEFELIDNLTQWKIKAIPELKKLR